MFLAGISDQNCLHLHSVAPLSVCLTRVDRVFKVKTPTRRITFHELITHFDRSRQNVQYICGVDDDVQHRQVPIERVLLNECSREEAREKARKDSMY